MALPCFIAQARKGLGVSPKQDLESSSALVGVTQSKTEENKMRKTRVGRCSTAFRFQGVVSCFSADFALEEEGFHLGCSPEPAV